MTTPVSDRVQDTETETPDSPGMSRETDGRLHYSRLKLMARCPEAYRAHRDVRTSAMTLGLATHRYLLEGGDGVVCYDGRRDARTKAYQAFLVAHPDAAIVSPSEMRTIRGMRDAVLAHPEARDLLDGTREQYGQWEVDGHDCAGTIDVWRLDHGAADVVELKTTSDAEPRRFLRDAERMAYHAQLDWYAESLVRRGLAERIGRLSIVAVESSAPHHVTVIHLSERTRLAGRELWRGWLSTLARCEALGDWPGYPSTTW